MGFYQEYLNSKGVIEKGKVDISGDRTDPMTPPVKPPKENPSQKPYISDGKSYKKGDKGFGDMGEKDTKYDVCCDAGSKCKEPAKIPTAEQAFAEIELVPLIVEAIEENPMLLEKIVFGMKRHGQLGALVAEVLSHRESYKHIGEIVKNESYGVEVCKKLERTMKTISEEVNAPFHLAATQDDDAADPEDLENGDQEDGEGLPDDQPEMGEGGEEQQDDADIGNVSTEEGEIDPSHNMDPTTGNNESPPEPLMNGNPAMAQFQRAFQRSFQKHFHRKMMGYE